MKVGFISMCIGSKSYVDMAIVTIMSYIETNTTEVDWLIFGDTNEELNYIQEKLSFIQNNKVHIKVLPFTKINLDFSKYNASGFVNNSACQIFCKRIKLIDIYKKDYDLLVFVDFDMLFVGDVSYYLIKAYTNDNAWISGHEQIELNNSERLHHINFGFAILKCCKLRNNEFEHFLEISKNKEDFYVSQDQTYYNYSYPDDKYLTYTDLQLGAWNYQWVNTHKPNYKIYHYHPMRFMDQTVSIDKKYSISGISWISDLVYDKYAECAERYSQYLSPEFIKNVRINNKRFLNERLKNKKGYLLKKRYFGL